MLNCNNVYIYGALRTHLTHTVMMSSEVSHMKTMPREAMLVHFTLTCRCIHDRGTSIELSVKYSYVGWKSADIKVWCTSMQSKVHDSLIYIVCSVMLSTLARFSDNILDFEWMYLPGYLLICHEQFLTFPWFSMTTFLWFYKWTQFV